MTGRDGTSDGLSLEEATAIAEHAREGRLQLDDPEIRKLVGEANRILVRTQMWGETPPTPRRRWKRRMLAVGAAALVAVWVIGLLGPLLLRIAAE
ncbi:hypothetical protein EDF24_3062 [Curtobacterium sp. PhB130]|uniref:hypothetical protein n=1 Tax=unclassified Curtobacterium TaxID=257496 RepID=UPI000F4B564D|nr:MULTISPECIES: hypothetical protein [unclassified Curtobacterium]ROP65895.1 hypothetical protein EDF55_0339 [Curtobacterium sp. ZW137]ROS74054.1 hypothetical protein EDF24_3062 [Curtobacterium sp. PhB130]TCK62870.1 hypothetical protein EDF27_2529 [Curtobacterium sp. PhB136]